MLSPQFDEYAHAWHQTVYSLLLAYDQYSFQYQNAKPNQTKFRTRDFSTQTPFYSTKLTKSTQYPDSKTRIEWCDKDLPELFIEVRANRQGQGTFYYYYKDINSKTCTQKVGRSSDIDLTEVRSRAKALRAEIALGANPRAYDKQRGPPPLSMISSTIIICLTWSLASVVGIVMKNYIVYVPKLHLEASDWIKYHACKFKLSIPTCWMKAWLLQRMIVVYTGNFVQF